MAIVYMATNRVNGKRYIGVTVKLLRQRRASHEYDAFKKGLQTKFGKALRKYGKGAFDWSVVAEIPDLAAARQAEIEAIANMKPEYNITLGGEGVWGLKHSEEARAKMRAAQTPERRARIAASFTGSRHSKESREKMSAAHKGKPNLKARGKKRSMEMVERARALGFENIETFRRYAHLGPAAMARGVICLDTGVRYESASEAARANGVAKSALIELCLGQRGRKTVGKLRFAYAKEQGDAVAA